ncbi:type II toxin-antitoxin system PemK/MazF family toxin [Cellulomonas cellasea]|uniref:type II toxin-antitoxin system PemK/MazF family toxin n=1 Tax=Cellulomonas cellasea TaxID=43670 RepID=UPI0025A41DCC|nr:type II toxin-antitoxin system PemK/MazF family toxin [Cellulomonas cellasea]MDM8086105.1 type II toxin-antitoxin system PemK/MazF family toxin [Cellulomonas cellasea]
MMDVVNALLDAQPEAAVVGLVVIAGAILAGLRRWLRPGPRPRPGEVWFADVPFEDRPGSKDRPVLVLAVAGRTCTVAAFTSQDRSARRDHVRLPSGVPGMGKASWIRLRPILLRRSALRRRISDPGPALVVWYDSVAQPAATRSR